MRTLVVGLGNPILTDDGVGVKVAYALEKALTSKDWRDVTITEASVGGLRLMEMMIGYDRVILIDALLGNGYKQPGRLHKMSLDDLRHISPTQHSASAHDTSLVTALDAGRQLGFHVPDEVIIFGIEVENISDFSDVPTPAVSEAIPKATAAVLEEINCR